MKKANVLLLGVAVSFVSLVFSPAGEYLGADALLRKLQEWQRQSGEHENPVKKMRGDIAAYAQVSATLPPEEAARRWLELADHFGKLTSRQLSEEIPNMNYGDQLSFRSILQVIPPPTAWDALVKLVDARTASGKTDDFKSIYVRLVAHWLTSDEGGLKKDLAALSEASQKLPLQRGEYLEERNFALKMEALANLPGGDDIERNLDEALEAFQRRTARFPKLETQNFEVPDLVPLIGEKKAVAFLRKALAVDHLVLSVEGAETQKLAGRLALEMSESLKAPQWGLAQSMDAGALYDALVRRFSESMGAAYGGDYDRRSAQGYRMAALVLAGKKAEAVQMGLLLGEKGRFPGSASDELAEKGRLPELADFFHDLLQANPDLPYWSNYVHVAVKIGEAEPMLALAEAAATRDGLAAKPKLEIQRTLRRAYLAADREEKGLAAFRKEMKLAADSSSGENSQEQLTGAIEFARLGKLLERPDVLEEGLKAARGFLAIAPGARVPRNRADNLEALAAFLAELDRGPEAEAMLLDALSSAGSDEDSPGHNRLLRLAALYDKAGRPADVITLLDRARQWGAGDLVEIYDESVSTEGNSDTLGYFAAAALNAQKRTAEAGAILQAVLAKNGGYDPAYELLVKMDPTAALKQLDTLYARDQYEERPLIWKAKLLLDAGKLEEAEAAARKAVSIDPSDGEQGPGRRMRVYAVLADIREARGDRAEAAILRGAVTAIRHSEAADRFYEAGLTTRAVKMYEEALTHFADAYCIQSRLALRMMELGDAAGAEEHYRRAYELMPQSFGRVESHCFGCEKAFDGEHPQSVAEKVFTQMVAKLPNNPQLHYLLGYLREEQNRPEAALPEYRAAVKLDPEYLNAWKKLDSVAGALRRPAAERDAIQLQMLKLDPLERHVSFDAGVISDHRAAWNALAEAAKHRLPEPEKLYPLEASAKVLAKTSRPEVSLRSDEPKTPSQALAKASFLEHLDNAFSMAGDLSE